ncbi:MAG: hypothetical protein Q7T71_12015, partial [Herbiconiux sp.]|nr:hypothetical protein [Herbiconiux sp.]
MVLRLSPAHPLVWRTPSSAQFGVHDPVAVLAAVSPAEQVLVELLLRGVAEPVLTEAAAARGVSATELAGLLHTLRFALERPGGGEDAVAQPAPVVAVDGRGPAAAAVAEVL